MVVAEGLQDAKPGEIINSRAFTASLNIAAR
jgi:hypothetical protein